MRTRDYLLAGFSVAAVAIAAPAVAQPAPQAFQFDIRAQALDPALREFAQATRLQIIFDGDALRGRRSQALTGRHSAEEGLALLLRGSGLAARRNAEGVYVVTGAAGNGAGTPASGEAQAGGAAADSAGADAGATPDILVIGRRTLNADARRTEDDVQPYVVFGAEELRQSQATTLEDFFRARLPMNGVNQSLAQGATQGTLSTIDLRGLGANQTLILVDGRRMPSVFNGGTGRQPDLNGIPLSAVERIEVLPATASGIYGGGATGGVVNIILRKDYRGVEVSAQAGTSSRGDAQNYRIDLNAGFSLGTHTRVLINASRASQDPLLVRDRDFVQRGRALNFANNPAAFLNATTPPLGASTNIRSQNGANLVLDNGTPLNSPRTYVPIGYPGRASDGGAALIANAGNYDLGIPDDVAGGLRNILAGSTTNSVTLNLRSQITGWLEAFADLSWVENNGRSYFAPVPGTATLAANAPNNPFNSTIVVSFPAVGLQAATNRFDTTTLRALSGIIVRLPGRWTAGADLSWSRARLVESRTGAVIAPTAPANNALNAGTLDVIRDLHAFPLDWSPYDIPSPNQLRENENTFVDANLRLSGPVFTLPGGDVTVSALAEWRKESAPDTFGTSIDTATGDVRTQYLPRRDQSSSAYYAETRVPIVSPRNAIPFLHRLELQGSVRYERTETNSPNPTSVFITPGTLPPVTLVNNVVSATTYTVGGLFSPIEDVSFRASYGTGFLPPALTQLIPNAPSTLTLALTDPKRGNVSSNVTFLSQGGGDPNLLPEESTSLSLGVVVTPRFLRGLRLSADFTRIEKTNEITLLSQQQVLSLEDLLPGRIVRNALTAADQALGYTGGTIRELRSGQTNVQGTIVEAWDFQVDYELPTRIGDFHLYAVATYQPDFIRQVVPGTPATNSAGYTLGPLEWRGNAGVTWTRGPWTASWNAQYYDSYFAYASTALPAAITATVLNQGAAKIRGQTFHDLFLRYRVGAESSRVGGALRGTEFAIGVQNVFDTRPSVIATTAAAQAGYSTYADLRQRRFTFEIRRAF